MTTIKENVTLFMKIASKSFMKWFFLVSIGSLFTLISSLITAFSYNLFTYEDGFSVYVRNLIQDNIFAFVIIFGLPLFIFLYVILANKYTIHYTIHQVWESKGQDFVIERLVKIVDKVVDSNQNISKITDASILKIKILHENATDNNSNKVLKKVSEFIIKKIRLDDVDLSNKELRISHIIAEKTTNIISEMTEASTKMTWVLLALHFILFVLTF